MRTKLKLLFEAHPSLGLNFQNSVYPAASFNFGPETACFPHTDAANDPCNFCHITALGRFDPKHSGRLILFDYKLVIEFPPGSSALIPSAIARHGNTGIRVGEMRQSFTQYCAGGLLRWVDAGFRTQATYAEEDPVGKAQFDAEAKERLRKALALFSKYDRLAEDSSALA